MQLPRVRALAVPGGHLGWQDLGGDGPPVLDLGPGFLASVEDAQDQPRYLRWVQGLAAIGRLLRYDAPGVGTSDTVEGMLGLVGSAEAAVLVLDAAGVDRAHVVAAGASSLVALHLVSRHPERVASLTLVNGAARITRGPDYPYGVEPDVAAGMVTAARDPEQVSDVDVDLWLQAPSMAEDDDFRSWWGRVARRNARPRVAGPLNEEIFSCDLRPVLAGVTVPALVVARSGMALGRDMTRVLAEGIPGSRFVELPGDDMVPFLGEIGPLLDEIRTHVTGSRATQPDRVFAAVLFTDLVGSTAEVERRGDRSWRELLVDHGDLVRAVLERSSGRLVQDLGDGTLCTFSSPGAAIRCALELVERAQARLGIGMRAGIHAGEVEMRGSDLAGITVHVAARVSALAGAGEVLVSSTVADLVAGGGFAFDERGWHDLKGVQGPRQVWAARSS